MIRDKEQQIFAFVTYKEKAQVHLVWSRESSTIRAVTLANDRTLFSTHFNQIEQFRTFQTIFSELGVEFKIAGETYKFIASVSDKKLWFLFFPGSFLDATWYNSAALEHAVGLDEVKQLCTDNGVEVRRSTTPKIIAWMIIIAIIVNIIVQMG